MYTTKISCPVCVGGEVDRWMEHIVVVKLRRGGKGCPLANQYGSLTLSFDVAVTGLHTRTI